MDGLLLVADEASRAELELEPWDEFWMSLRQLVTSELSDSVVAGFVRGKFCEEPMTIPLKSIGLRDTIFFLNIPSALRSTCFRAFLSAVNLFAAFDDTHLCISNLGQNSSITGCTLDTVANLAYLTVDRASCKPVAVSVAQGHD
jgi:hypothetical protein